MANAPPPSPAPSKRRKLPATVVALGLTSFFTDCGTELIFPLLPAFIASLGAAPAFLGLVEGAADATSSLLKLASGRIADRSRSSKPLVLFGYGLAAVVRPLVALATAPWHVLAIRVSDRVGKGVRGAPRDALLAASVDKDQAGRAFGFHQAMDHAGAIVGPLVASALLAAGVSLRAVFAAAIVPGALSVIGVLAVREPPRPAPAAPALGAPAAPAPAKPLPRALTSYLAILALFSLGNSSDAFLLLRAKDLGVPVASLPLLWAAFHVSKLVTSYLGGDLSDRVARHKLILLGWGVYAATYLGFGFATRAWQAWALLLVYGAYHGLTEPVEKALVRDLAPADARGRAYGAYGFLLGATAVPAGVLTGWLWQAFSPKVAMATGAAIAAAAAAALVAWSAARERAVD
jgi:MFS family permease